MPAMFVSGCIAPVHTTKSSQHWVLIYGLATYQYVRDSFGIVVMSYGSGASQRVLLDANYSLHPPFHPPWVGCNPNPGYHQVHLPQLESQLQLQGKRVHGCFHSRLRSQRLFFFISDQFRPMTANQFESIVLLARLVSSVPP